MMKRICLGLFIAVAIVWALNTNLFVISDASPKLLSHRGVHQTHLTAPRDGSACTAEHIDPPTHEYIENTLASMRAAAAAGAQVIELDVHLTTDGVFAVFHDWTLECRTDGIGVTEQQTFADLKRLDVGFGYTTDGKTYPLRGKGVGLMPSLQEVLRANIGVQYLINFKSTRAEEGTALATLLQNPRYRAQVWGVYGGAQPTQAALSNIAALQGFDKSALKRCLITYAAVGWFGHVPEPCRNRIIAVPMDIGPYLWGWPHRFTHRMKSAGTQVVLWGPYDGTGYSSGVDDAATLAQVPDGFDGYIWTNRIEVIGNLVAAR